LLVKHKELGKVEENNNVSGGGFRFLVSGNYKIVYRIIDSKSILIASVFDCRQNPEKMMNT
jgi:plasmid stabilization system protein ParE